MATPTVPGHPIFISILVMNSEYEIMAPVGSRESLTAAIQAGADSIYFGIERLNMRAHSASAFTIDDLKEIAQICSEHDIIEDRIRFIQRRCFTK